jgi:hypothetical protein
MIIRVLLMIFAFLLASVAAAIVIAVYGSGIGIMFQMIVANVPPLPLAERMLRGLRLIGAIAATIASLALVPAMIIAIFAEGLRVHSAIFYAFAGGCVGLISEIALFCIVRLQYAGYPKTPDFTWNELAAGIVAGLMYWAIAGRKAGNWRVAVTAGSPTPPIG